MYVPSRVHKLAAAPASRLFTASAKADTTWRTASSSGAAQASGAAIISESDKAAKRK
jgi:hypothetical protein